MRPKHTRTLGPRIVADYRLLNHLRARPSGSLDDIVAGSTILEVEGGAIASSCEDDHDEILRCWAFYRRAKKAD